MLIATIPAPFKSGALAVARTPEVDAFRFNTGVSVSDPRVALKKLRLLIPAHKTLWVDLKCRQLRVSAWADPSFSEVTLNREVEVELPAFILFRGSAMSEIAQVEGNKIFLTDPPRVCVGRGQSVNILSNNLTIKGPLLTDLDQAYLSVCAELGIHTFMASYIQSWEDVRDLLYSVPGKIYLKIEDQKGLSTIVESDAPLKGVNLELARDDLFNELRGAPSSLLSATQDALRRDPETLVASKFFPSLLKTGESSLADMEDIIFLHNIGYKNFMFQDELSDDPIIFRKAAQIFQECIKWAQEKQ
jgi:hypothetical protein